MSVNGLKYAFNHPVAHKIIFGIGGAALLGIGYYLSLKFVEEASLRNGYNLTGEAVYKYAKDNNKLDAPIKSLFKDEYLAMKEKEQESNKESK